MEVVELILPLLLSGAALQALEGVMPAKSVKPELFPRESLRSAFASLVPVTEGISCTGRRVACLPYTKDVELYWAGARKERSPRAILKALSKISVEFTHAGDAMHHGQIVDYSNSVLLTEEADLLLLSRWVNYGHEALISHQCPVCGTMNDELMLDLRKMRRKLFECSDPECYCHEANRLTKEATDEEYDAFVFMNEHWSQVPEDHLRKAPTDLVYTPDPRYGAQDLKVHCRFLTVGDQHALGPLALEDSEEEVRRLLEVMVTRFEWPSQLSHPVDDKPTIRQILSDMPLALRMGIKSFIDSKAGGDDTSVNIQCKTEWCRRVARQQLPFDPQFFMPNTHR